MSGTTQDAKKDSKIESTISVAEQKTKQAIDLVNSSWKDFKKEINESSHC